MGAYAAATRRSDAGSPAAPAPPAREPAAEDLGLLDALFEGAPVGLAVYGEGVRCLRANQRLTELLGVPAAAHLGRTPAEALGALGHRLEGLLAATLESGVARRDVPLTAPAPGDPGATRYWLVSLSPVRGAPTRVGLAITDVTRATRVEKERRRLLLEAREARERAEQAERRSAFLASAGKLLASTLVERETFEAIARLAVPEIADWCFVELLREDGSIVREAFAAADPAVEATMRRSDERYPLDPDAVYGSPVVIRTGRPLLAGRIPDAVPEGVAAGGEQLALLRELGAGSHMIVALRARGRVLGDIALGCAESGRTFDEEDLALAVELADRCALALDTARLYARRG